MLIPVNLSAMIISKSLAPGRHELTCQVREETNDPNGGHEVR